nr:adenosylcobinamide-phosphate synthase CbiB [Microvirga antarctica]
MPFFLATLSTTLTALAVEAAGGYPARIYAAIGHPVTWFGSLIGGLEQVLNRLELSPSSRRFRGVVALVATLVLTVGAAVVVSALASRWLAGGAVILLGILASTLIAQRSLHDHVRRVASGLSTSLGEGRMAVAHIVGRDPQTLDRAAVARAAIESLAENFSDGVVAPVLYLAVAGLPGAVAYKTINTADSMIGHRSPRYEAYGWAAARLDDLVNLPASRLSALLIVTAAALRPGCSALEAARAVWRDASRHRSPNAGWPEAAMAGALGLRLAGPRTYDGVVVQDGWMGHGRSEAEASDILAALALYRLACTLQALVIAVVLVTGGAGFA